MTRHSTDSGHLGSRPARPDWIVRAVWAVLAVHAGLLAWGASIHSPGWDEWGHLPAGISHWHLGQFDLYRVNPPLVRMVAAAPVLFCGPEIEWPGMSGPHWRPEWEAARSMVRTHSERLFWWFTLARWACIAFSLLGGWICFRWARDLYGPPAGLTAAMLWCFSPLVLGHAQMITPDAPSAAMGAAAGYVFWQWLKQPTASRAFVAGVVLALAQLTKFTWVILFGIWPLVWLVWRVRARPRGPTSPRPGAHGSDQEDSGGEDPRLGETRPRAGWMREAGQMALLLAVAVYAINLGYGFEGTGTRLGDFRFVSRPLRTVPASDGPSVAAHVGNRFAGTFWGRLPVPLPLNYVAGIDRQKYDFDDAGFWSYLRGEWRDRGWWYYYLYGLAVKEPVGTWLLALAASVAAGGKRPGWRDELLVLVPVLAVLVLVSSQTGFNHHLRYVLPMYPFAFIWISRAARLVSRKTPLWGALVVVSLTWSVGSSLRHYPHSLSYFNELVGGPRYGHDHLLDSNIDWGQDLLLLKRWVNRHPEARPLGVAYSLPSAIIDMAEVGIPAVPVPRGPLPDGTARLLPEETGPLPGWYAIFVRELRERQGWYAYFRHFEPAAMVGYTVYIYHISLEDANRVRQQLGLAELPPGIQPATAPPNEEDGGAGP